MRRASKKESKALESPRLRSVEGSDVTGEEQPQQSTWWDRHDAPPRAVTASVDWLSRKLPELRNRPAKQEGQVGRIVGTTMLAAVFLVGLWLILASILEQA